MKNAFSLLSTKMTSTTEYLQHFMDTTLLNLCFFVDKTHYGATWFRGQLIHFVAQNASCLLNYTLCPILSIRLQPPSKGRSSNGSRCQSKFVSENGFLTGSKVSDAAWLNCWHGHFDRAGQTNTSLPLKGTLFFRRGKS